MLGLTSDQLQLAAILATVTVAFVGYIVTYSNSLRLKRLDAQYEFVTAQLRDLYGPLFALTSANSRTWAAFRRVFRPGRRMFTDPSDPMTEDEIKKWSYWVTHVFQPSNRRMKQIIEANAHLFDERQLPTCVLDFLGHAYMFELVVANWQSGDYSILFTPIPYPKQIDVYVEQEYLRVSELHAQLSGRKAGRRLRRAGARVRQQASTASA